MATLPINLDVYIQDILEGEDGGGMGWEGGGGGCIAGVGWAELGHTKQKVLYSYPQTLFFDRKSDPSKTQPNLNHMPEWPGVTWGSFASSFLSWDLFTGHSIWLSEHVIIFWIKHIITIWAKHVVMFWTQHIIMFWTERFVMFRCGGSRMGR